MFFALGAASSAIDALKALTSSKSSSAQSTGASQDAQEPVRSDVLGFVGFGRLGLAPDPAAAVRRYRRRP